MLGFDVIPVKTGIQQCRSRLQRDDSHPASRHAASVIYVYPLGADSQAPSLNLRERGWGWGQCSHRLRKSSLGGSPIREVFTACTSEGASRYAGAIEIASATAKPAFAG